MERLLQLRLLSRSNAFLAIKIVAIAAATIVLFSQDLTMIFLDALQSETTSHILAIPILFAYLVYRKRKMLRATIPLENQNQPQETRHLSTIAGILLSVTAVLLYWHGSHTFTPLEYHLIALPIFVTGISLIIFNPQTLRQLAFPIAFLIFLTPPPSEILYYIGATLQVLSAEASNAIANLVGIPSTITLDYGSPTIILTKPDGATLSFAVDIACSGIYSLIGFTIFTVFVAYIIRDKLWKKITLFLIGLPLVYLLNITRITIMLLLGYYYGEETALQAFHLFGGWVLIFLGTLLLLIISEKIFKTQIFTKPSKKCPQYNPEPKSGQNFCQTCGKLLKPGAITLQKSDIIKLSAIALTVILLMSIQAPVFVLTETSPLIIIDTPSGQQASTGILPQVPGYDVYFSYRDTEFEALAKQDMSLIYVYSPSNESEQPIWVALEFASTLSSLHRWETCLITYPMSHDSSPKATQIELKDVQLTENPPIISRYFVFNYTSTGETQAVLYWYESSTFTVNSTSQQEHVKISLIAYPETMESLPEIENQLITLATAITSYWQPIKTWSQVTLIISQNGANLATLTGIAVAAIIIFYILNAKRQKSTNANAYQKLSKPNKEVVDAVAETKKSTLPTLGNIATTYEKTTQKPIKKEELLQKIRSLENMGLIKSEIASRQDEPIQIWKTWITLK